MVEVAVVDRICVYVSGQNMRAVKSSLGVS